MDTRGTLDALAVNASATCEFCGKPLRTTSVTVPGRTYGGLPCFGSCGCTASRNKLESLEHRESPKDAKYTRAGIAKRYLAAKEDVAEYAAIVAGGGWLYVHGPNGDGKTRLASCIAKALVDAGKSVRFEYARELLTERFDDSADVVDRVSRCDVLFIDDVGKDVTSAFAASCLFEIIDQRYREMKPTVCTSNYSRPELARKLEECGDERTAAAIVSRLCDDCLTVELDGTDRRLA